VQLKAFVLSVFGIAMCAVFFLWGVIAVFRPDRLRSFEIRITRADRFGVSLEQYRRGIGLPLPVY
jgi:hypothetical protein